jgi:hypothetical protein
MNNLYGLSVNPFLCIKVIESPYAVEKTNEPMRVHQGKEWMVGRSYHDRIQKKWNKRFGFAQKPCIFKTKDGYIAHPSLAHALRRSFRTESMNFALDGAA